MTDTPPELARRYRTLLLARSGEERLKMGCSMHAAAKALARASILERDPLISPAGLRQALFLRFYGDDFDAGSRQRILGALGSRVADGRSDGRPHSPEKEQR